MLYKYFTEKLTGLQGLSIEKVEENQNTIHIHCKLERKKHKCPCCGKLTNTIHDYREQVIKDIPAFGKYVFIHIKKKRYRCTCGKRFAEKNKFLPRYHRMTNRLSAYIIDKLRDAVTYTSVAREMKLFVRTMFFLPCYEFGRFYKAVLEKKDTLNNVAYFAIIFVVQLILLTFCENLEYTPSSFTNFNNGFVIPYISSITAIAFWLRVSRLLVPAIGNSKLVRLIADNTYGIMVNQLVGFMCLKFVFYGLSCITSGSLFGDFNIASFKSSIWYYYLPNGLQQWAFVYLIFGLFVPILISIILNKICNIVRPSSYLKKI